MKPNFEFKTKESKPEVKNVIENNFKPILSCIIDSTKVTDEQIRETLKSIEKNGQYINFFADKDFHEKNNIKNEGETSYFISEANEKDKYSKRYNNCTGVVVVGEEKNSKKQISFLSHQNPRVFLGYGKNKFIKDLKESIKEIKDKTKEGSVAVSVFGGNKGNNQYKESIKLLGEVTTEELNFEPNVVTGPNLKSIEGSTRVYFDTQNRRLYIVRPHQESEANENYLPSEIKEKSEKWPRDEGIYYKYFSGR